MVFHWRLSDSKSPQVFRTLLSIVAVFNNDVWMVSTRLPTSKSSRPFNNPLVTVPKAPITIGIIVTFIFHSFFLKFSSKVEVLISLFTFFQFYSVVIRDSKVNNFAGFLFFVVDYYKVWYYYDHSLIRAFHISVSRWFFTGVRVTASLLKSPGLFSVFWRFSVMLSFGWSPPVRQPPTPPVPLVIL